MKCHKICRWSFYSQFLYLTPKLSVFRTMLRPIVCSVALFWLTILSCINLREDLLHVLSMPCGLCTCCLGICVFGCLCYLCIRCIIACVISAFLSPKKCTIYWDVVKLFRDFFSCQPRCIWFKMFDVAHLHLTHLTLRCLHLWNTGFG